MPNPEDQILDATAPTSVDSTDGANVEDGDIFDYNTGEFIGSIDMKAATPIPPKIQIAVGKWWYIYTITDREEQAS